MGSYGQDRCWSDGFIPAIKQIVGPHLLDITPDEIDCTQAADLYVFTARDMKIAARIRRAGYADRYPYQFTIRARRDSGAETELSKIINGWGDWLFYGHAADDDALHGFARWWIISLASLRAALIRHERNRAPLRFGDQANGDGTYFKWFDLQSFPAHPPILIAGSHALPLAEAA